MKPLYNVVFLIPLHKKDTRIERCISSVPSDEKYIPVIITTEEIKKWLLEEVKVKEEFIRVIEPDEETGEINTSYQSLVNYGIEKYGGRTHFISILEYDDVLSFHMNEIFDGYMSEDGEDIDVYAPLTMVVKEDESGEEEKNTLIGVSNEAPFAPGIAEEEGKYDFNMMLRSNFLFLNGTFIRPRVFEEVGMLKENFDAFYDYEFSLRMVYNGMIIKSVPKVTHMHTMNENGEFRRQSEMPKNLREKWLGAARREYFFTEDRELDMD